MQSNKALSLFSLVMINVVAIDNLKSLPFGAKFGFSLVFYYVLAALFFFIPVALVAAECATGWPNRGGMYVWVREALGNRWAFFVIWIVWIYNVVWYPSQMIYIAGMFWRWVSPDVLADGHFMFLSSSILFVFCTVLNRFGMRCSGIISSTGAVFGTLLPMAVIIIAGAYWFFFSPDVQINLANESVMPVAGQTSILPFLVPIIFGLIGIEMSAFHANDVDNPQKTYPKAIFISTVLIVSTMLLSSISIALIVPKNDLSIITGIVQVFEYIFKDGPLHAFKPVMVILVLWGGIANVATWVIGPSKGMLVAARDGTLPKWFAHTNVHDVPERILWTQCVLVILLSLGMEFLPIEIIYTMLNAITTQLALFAYILMFVSVLVLRRKHPKQAAYQVPGGILGLVIVCLSGILISVAVVTLGFVAPQELDIPPGLFYSGILAFGVMLFASIPWLIKKRGENESA